MDKSNIVCVRVIQHTKGTADQTQVAEVKEIEKTLLGFVNAIVDQYFSEAPKYNPCDIRYQGFTDQTGKGRGMVTISRRSQDTFNTDVAVEEDIRLPTEDAMDQSRATAWAQAASLPGSGQTVQDV